MVVRKFDFIQFRLCLFEIGKNVLTGRSVFPAQLMNHVQSGLDLLQLVGGIAQAVPGVPDLLRRVLHLIHKVGYPIMKL